MNAIKIKFNEPDEFLIELRRPCGAHVREVRVTLVFKRDEFPARLVFLHAGFYRERNTGTVELIELRQFLGEWFSPDGKVPKAAADWEAKREQLAASCRESGCTVLGGVYELPGEP
jgi:hypothetical protein